MPEFWDAYDRDFNKIEGLTLVRGEPIPQGVYFIAVTIIVKHIDGSFLLMQRDPSKNFGGKWELTAGGAAQKGESAVSGAVRELFEETGIAASELKEIKHYVDDRRHYHKFIYLCLTDCRKDAVRLQEGETVAFRWVSREEFLRMDASELAVVYTRDAVIEFGI